MTLERMPTLTGELRDLKRERAEQELLDPPAAQRTVERLERGLAAVVPQLVALRARQDQIIAEFLDLIG